MSDNNMGINPNISEMELNRILDGAVTRIKRSISVKEVALEKIRKDDPESRAYGFKHINIIIEFQVSRYLGYINRLRQFLGMMNQIQLSFDNLQPLENGFFEKRRFNRIKGKIEANIIAFEEKIPLIEVKINELYSNVLFQKQLLSVQMTGDQEAQLKAKITLEIEESQELIKDLRKCMNLSFKAVKNFSVFQVGFMNFLRKVKKTKGGNLIDDSETVVERIQSTISFFYAFKTEMLIMGLTIGFLSTNEDISMYAAKATLGFVIVDQIMDAFASLPAQRKIFKNIPGLVRALKRKEENFVNRIVRIAKVVPVTKL